MEHVLAQLRAASDLLAGADPEAFEQGEIHLKAALETLISQGSGPAADSNDLRRIQVECRRISGLLGAAGEFYLDLTRAVSIQELGYGSAGAKSQSETGKRFVISA
jgi:hypothetical protein